MALSYSKSTAFTVIAVLLTGCSTVSDKQYLDPFENTNRGVHAFNEGFDEVVLTPVSKAYVAVTPDPVEKGVSNFFDNLGYPSVVLNQFLQGKVGDGFEGIGRFGINSTLGLFGLFDVATEMGLEAGLTLSLHSLAAPRYAMVLAISRRSSLTQGSGSTNLGRRLAYLQAQQLIRVRNCSRRES